MNASAPAAAPRSIVTLGEIVVEIMADEPGNGFREPIGLRGPFASGAPAIFIDQVAKLGHPAGLISCVGDDDFGRLNIERLRADGVDVSAIRVHPEHVTGSAFVRYRADGERDFVFNIKNSACGQTRITAEGDALLDRCGHFHVMGSSMFSFRLIDEAKTALGKVKRNGGTVSFDPNVRKEMLGIPEMRAALEMMLQYCDVFLPSGPELMLLTEAKNEADAIREILGLGVSAIVVKRGSGGASYHDRDGDLHVPALPVREIDPTGAGDCFGATFVTCRLQGMPPAECLRYAAASGALAVTRRGPMEGTAGFADLDALIASS
ncbi:tagatose kinase [Rhizosaccharibacter radicis]|uniref:Sugar kinase n=1 Tax=Rhizosaccharibacter radicis TaxID=2782605 RepID=A0ABT1VXX1_9PROT|nr:sugar kinase [Acetobacteraceae bacterium KSS12]